MKVTLYKNCKLNNKYKDVFFNKTYLESYLSTLDKIIPLEDTDIFSREVDNLYIDDVNIPDFKQYNYIKIEDSIGTFYAFINNIKWINEVYQIFYEEDVMSNWFEYAHIRNSLLTGNKSLKLYKGNAKRDINYYKYNVTPESNNYINFTPYNIQDMSEGQEYPEVSIIVKLQYYTLVEGGGQSDRQAVLGFIRFFDRDRIVDDEYYQTYKFYHLTAINYIDLIMNNANRFSIGTDRYYEIDKIYVVPSSYIDTNPANFNINKTTIYNISGDYHKTLDVAYYMPSGYNFTGLIKTYTKTIKYNRINDSIGLFSSPIKILNNGTDILLKIDFYIMGYDIKFILNFQNKMIDIAEEFNVDMPYYQLNASSVQLQRLQIELQKNALENSIANANEEFNKYATNLAVGAFSGLGSATASALTGDIVGAIKSAESALTSSSNNYAGLVISENNVEYASKRINLINKAVYSNSSIKVNKYSIINGIFGVCLFTIIEDNTSQVNASVKLNGYIVRELVNDVIQELDIENLTDNYDVFKFDDINIYGIISQDYIRIIEKILKDGVRVWCQGDIGELV